jgi:hypothetical protein
MKTTIFDVTNNLIKHSEISYKVRRLEEGDLFTVESILLNTKINTPFAVIKVDGYGYIDCPLGQILKVCPFEDIKDHKFMVTGFKESKIGTKMMKMPIIKTL